MISSNLPGSHDRFEDRLLAALASVDGERPRVPASMVSLPAHVGPRWRLALPIAGASAGVLVLAATAAAGLLGPAGFQPAGEVAVVGSSVLVKGSGCQAGGTVSFDVDGAAPVGSTTAGIGGLFSYELRLPASTRPGRHDLAATCAGAGGGTVVQHASLSVVSSLPAMPASLSQVGDVVAGGATMVKGSGCRASSQVAFAIDGGPPSFLTIATSDGLFATALAVPAGLAPGVHDLLATCVGPEGAPLLQHAELSVVASAPSEPPAAK